LDLVAVTALEHSQKVACMAEPHMHSEIEVDLVRTGAMTYLFSGGAVTLPAGRLVVFWGPCRTGSPRPSPIPASAACTCRSRASSACR
jgi:hypothetical protein